MSEMKDLIHLKIPLQAIKDCTQDFNETNYIGKGGYGKVYKGILNWKDYQNLPVAVKQLDVTGFQGSKEFYTEILMLSQYRHKNIVNLIGFCDDGNEMILVYEYASHGSLDTYLSDPSKLGLLSWEKRLDICVGAASALDYLHNHVATNHRLIHRDVKSANILLDENWNAKLSDFGLSKICLANQHNTFVVTHVAGTHGYCDPQYERTGILTKESDVYSFGLVLFEVLCGRLACVFQYKDERRFLQHFARTCYENGELDKIIDHRIREHIMPKSLDMFSAIAYQCLQKTREPRPTIAEVALTLENVSRVQIGAPIIKISNHPPSLAVPIPPPPQPLSPMIRPPPQQPISPTSWGYFFSTNGDTSSGKAYRVSLPYRMDMTRIENLTWVNNRSEERPYDNYFQTLPMQDGGDSYGLEDANILYVPIEDGPGIESFQIIGVANPGRKLLGCGFSVRGTSLCMFQWVRYYQDGTRKYIEGKFLKTPEMEFIAFIRGLRGALAFLKICWAQEFCVLDPRLFHDTGATSPEYVVTADDVDKVVALECIPMDDQGHQGKMLGLFVNE
ncbi:hypothetical protein OSB04_013181 [Centaurea solstitialis]|uniref:Protein kinase domain-containing protein n=1 Tax=Centaurea solstitialis TaxID=347529 RepID=A0AA38TVT1_9ASTR|nr:hypothetical protein OSB04_013181 [Centaurea solstitialis]